MPSSAALKIRKTWPNIKPVTEKIDTIQAIASDYDVIVFDQWGVLHNGTVAYADAINAVTSLKVTCAVLSNSGKRSEPNAKRINAMGFPPEAFGFAMTSGEALWRDISGGKIDGNRFFAVERAQGDAATWAEGLGIEFAETPKQADAILLMGLPDGANLNDWTASIDTWRYLNLPVYCSNPDRQSPRADGLVMSPGAIAYAYQDVGGPTTFYGKPHLPIFQSMEEVFGEGKYLMVGDSMEHDIAGAHGAGWDSLLIQGGLYVEHFKTGDQNATLKDIAAEKSCALPTYRMEGLQ